MRTDGLFNKDYKMTRGISVAFMILIISFVVPGVHYFTGPIGPFVAGFVGGGIAKANEGKIITFGLLVAGLMLIPSIGFLIAALLSESNILGLNRWLMITMSVAIVPYTWFGVTVGALISYLVRLNSEKNNTK